MSQHAPDPSASMYMPAIAVRGATFKHSLAKLEVTVMNEPNEICGMAQRVGYTGSRETDLAIYRLKIRSRHYRSTITLPGFYVIHDGLFIDYERWSKECETT